MTWLSCNLHSRPSTKHFPSLEAAIAADFAQGLKRSNLSCGGCDSSRLEGGVWGGEAPPGKSLNFFLIVQKVSGLRQLQYFYVSNPGGFWEYFLTFLARDGPLEWVRPIPNAPERSWHASGPIFSPNHRFWTHFGSFLMFLARLENQVWAKA